MTLSPALIETSSFAATPLPFIVASFSASIVTFFPPIPDPDEVDLENDFVVVVIPSVVVSVPEVMIF